jgi:integrase
MTQVTTLYAEAKRFVEERSFSVCQTTLATDYTQFLKWIARCPVQNVAEGRAAMSWVLNQEPRKASRKVAIYLRAFYRWAANEDIALVPRNPVASFKFPKPPQQELEVVVIPKLELPFVFAGLAVKNGSANKWDLVSRFMHQTALRTGEAFAVKKDDIKDGKLLIHSNLTLTHGIKNSTKTNKKRWVPLNDTAMALLEEAGTASPYFFPWNRSAFQSFFVDRMQILHDQGVISQRYRPYDLRHTAITQWLEAGVPVAQVASWAGNSAEVIWKHYAGASQEYQVPTL